MASFDRPQPQSPRRVLPQAQDRDSQVLPESIAMPDENVERLRRTEKVPLEPWSGAGGHKSWIYSTLIHTAILVTLALVWQPVVRGTNGVADRPIGIALVHHQNAGVQYELQGGGDPSVSGESLAVAMANATSASGSNNIDAQISEMLGSLNSALQGVDVSAEATGATGASGIQGEGSGGDTRGDAAQTKTSFMGIEGQGSSFVYVLDRSDSMDAYDGTPMQRAKRELVASIESLGRVNQFQIIFYSQYATPYRGSISGTGGMIFASDVDKRAAGEYVQKVEASGSTDHFPALEMGLQLQPSVLFFLTDGDEPALRSDQMARVHDLASRAGTTIHTIQFGVGVRSGGGEWIADLASKTGGKYRYIDVTQFARQD